MNTAKRGNTTYTLVALAMLSALVVVLQLFSNLVTFGPVSFTLALVPIVIGALVFGPAAGALLGGVLGIVNLIATFKNPFLMVLFSASPFMYILVCVGKTVLAGLAAGFLYRLLAKKEKFEFVAVCAASLATPVVNTGVFLLMMALFFRNALTDAAVQVGMVENAAQIGSIWTFVMVSIITWNFFIEFGVNAVLSVAIDRIVRAVRRNR